jgi:hypothetical protein
LQGFKQERSFLRFPAFAVAREGGVRFDQRQSLSFEQQRG